jgi:hypothetical protein
MQGHETTLAGARAADAEFLSPAEYAKSRGVSIATVRRYIAAGVIPSEQPRGKRGRLLIPRAALVPPVKVDMAPCAVPVEPSIQQAPAPQQCVRRGPRPRWKNI